MSEGPWVREPSGLPGPEALPDAAPVVVIGGGLAGVAAALFLAEEGQPVVLLESRNGIGRGASGRHPGLVSLGLAEPPFRLVHALGPEGAGALYRFTVESRDLLADRVPLERTGGLWVALASREADELVQSRDALSAIGFRSEVLSAEAVTEEVGAPLGPALRMPDDGVIDPHAAVRTLADQAVAAGARLQVGCAVTDIAQENDGVRVYVGERSVLADAVVFAANPWLPGIHPFFEDKITPYREQAVAARVARPVHTPFRTQWGYFTGRGLSDGRMILRGARWATPHMEVGEDSEDTLPVVQDKIDSFLRRFDPTEITDRWAWIEAMSCDGLPIVGPMPGAPRYTCCAGFNGNQAGLALRAARAVVDGLLTGQSPGVPRFLSASRFL